MNNNDTSIQLLSNEKLDEYVNPFKNYIDKINKDVKLTINEKIEVSHYIYMFDYLVNYTKDIQNILIRVVKKNNELVNKYEKKEDYSSSSSSSSSPPSPPSPASSNSTITNSTENNNDHLPDNN